MKKLLMAIIVGTVMAGLGAERQLKVLMVGNSFSISNIHNMPQICKDMGLELELGSLYIGGCSLERHWNNVVAATNATFKPYDYALFRGGEAVADAPKKANIPEIVKGTKWDIITLQQASHFSWKIETYSPYFDSLCAKFKEWCPQAEIVLQETWSYTPWDKRLADWKIDQHQMYAHLHRAYYDIASSHGLKVIPMGTAVQLWRERRPVKYAENSFGGDVCGYEGPNNFVQIGGKWMPNPGKVPPGGKRRRGGCDVFHLNRRGQYFQSLVWTAKLFGADVTKCGFNPEFVTESDAALMKRVAMAAVAGELPSPAFGGAAK